MKESVSKEIENRLRRIPARKRNLLALNEIVIKLFNRQAVDLRNLYKAGMYAKSLRGKEKDEALKILMEQMRTCNIATCTLMLEFIALNELLISSANKAYKFTAKHNLPVPEDFMDLVMSVPIDIGETK